MLMQVQAAHKEATQSQRERLAQQSQRRAQRNNPTPHGFVWFYERK
ncbi:hypothetical protein BH09PLA1_BH09PLA1_29650 [soil metagenome]